MSVRAVWTVLKTVTFGIAFMRTQSCFVVTEMVALFRIVGVSMKQKATSRITFFHVSSETPLLTHRHWNKRQLVHRNHCSRNQDRRKLFHLCDGRDDDAVGSENASKNIEMDDV